MDSIDLYEIFRDICKAHSNAEEWRTIHCFGVGYLADLNANNFDQSTFRKDYFYAQKWENKGRTQQSPVLDFPMCIMEPPTHAGEVERNGIKTTDLVYTTTIYIADLCGYDRNNNSATVYAKRSKEVVWRDTELMGLQILKEFNRVGYASQPKFSLGNNGRYRGDRLYDVANQKLIITSFEISIVMPAGCIDGTTIHPPPQPPTPSIVTGTTLYWGGTRWERLAPGNDGEVLTTHGDGLPPSWEQAQSEDETDPVFINWLNTIAQVNNWNAAFSWGNHALGGYASQISLNSHVNDLNNPHQVTKAQVGLGNVDNTADANKPVSTAQQTAINQAEQNAKNYADGLVVGLWDDRGSFSASGGAYPSTGGSGAGGAILKGDAWTISVAGTLPTGQVVEVGDVIRALVDTPGNTQLNWAITQNNIGYVAENSANKAITMTGNTASNTLYLTAKAVYDWAVATFQTIITAASWGTFINSLTAKTSLVDADNFTIWDSVTSLAKKVSFSTLKTEIYNYVLTQLNLTTRTSYFDDLINGFPNQTQGSSVTYNTDSYTLVKPSTSGLNHPLISGRPGVIQWSSTLNSSAQGHYIYFILNLPIDSNLNSATTEWCVNPVDLSSGGDKIYTLRVGFIGYIGNNNTDGAGCYFRYTHNVNSGKWECVNNNGATETASDSGITVTANTWVKLKVVVTQTDARFYVDGVLVQTIATNLPATLVYMGTFFVVHTNSSFVSKSIAMDFYRYDIVINNTR